MKTEGKDLPALVDAVARWDDEAQKVRYYATFDETDAWVEISGEEFSNVTRANVQDAVVAISHHVGETLSRVQEVLDEFGTFREKMEDMFGRHAQAAAQKEGN